MSTVNELSKEAKGKLDGIWSVQLFYRNFPYYFQRANKREKDALNKFDYVISESTPAMNLPPELQKQLDLYLEQVWIMAIIYNEAIYEHFFMGLIETLGFGSGKLPRAAWTLYVYLKNELQKKYKTKKFTIPESDEWQLHELTATRHIWVHKNGIVDSVYLTESYEWWNSVDPSWFEKRPVLGSKRILSEQYIKSNLSFSKYFVDKVDEVVTNILS